jgi:5-formyltetrahydrofolate cyclo-ligase
MADPTAAQMVIVPMLAVDRRGFRVGYGKGYYDYFLSRMDTVTVGVCFGDEIVDWVPNEAHDVPVQYIATENGVISAAK